MRLLGDATATRALTGELVSAIRSSAKELIKELAAHVGHGEVTGRPTVTQQVVLVAARGPIDEVLVEALGQLLENHHIEVLSAPAAADKEAFRPDAARCHVCVLSAAPARSSSGLHLTARKARLLYPGLPFVSGIYSKDEVQSVSHEGDDLDQRCSSVHELLRALQSHNAALPDTASKSQPASVA